MYFDQFSVFVEGSNGIRRDIQRAPIPAVEFLIEKFQIALLLQLLQHPLSIRGVRVKRRKICPLGLFFGSKTEQAYECGIAGQQRTLGGRDVIAGKILLEEGAVFFLTLVQRFLPASLRSMRARRTMIPNARSPASSSKSRISSGVKA